jgi:hypothetical protein
MISSTGCEQLTNSSGVKAAKFTKTLYRVPSNIEIEELSALLNQQFDSQLNYYELSTETKLCPCVGDER